MPFQFAAPILCVAALLCSCGSRSVPEEKLSVAAAANLTDVFGEVGRTFKANTGVDVVFTYGATAQLAQQVENGAPFDVFAAADTEHISALVARQKLTADSQAVYARGQLALWIPNGVQSGVQDMKSLGRQNVRFVAVAQPDLAPYGRASIEALKHSGLWESVQTKLVYANTISQAKQLAESGNADAAFTAYSLVLHDRGTILKVDPAQYSPLEQALGIVAASPRIEVAKRFRQFLLGAEGRAVLAKGGYLLP